MQTFPFNNVNKLAVKIFNFSIEICALKFQDLNMFYILKDTTAFFLKKKAINTIKRKNKYIDT